MPPKAKRSLEGSNERTDTFYGVQLTRTKDVLEWPYKTPSPEFMGKSGFYFTPTKKFKDRTTCFCCKKTQSSWKDVKDPTAYHLKLNPDCSFSKILFLSKERSSNPEFDWLKVEEFRDPISKQATEIRRNTFGSSWPHDKVEGSNVTSENLVNVGFYYSPLDAGDDLAICIYCGVSLEGWEYDDDPLFEHQKRSTDCYFLNHLKKGNELKQSIKRSSSIAIIEEDEGKESEEDENTHQQNNRSLRPQRKRKTMKELNSEGSIEDEDESFAITANDEEFDDDEYYEGSKPKISKTKSIKKSSQSKISYPNSSQPKSSFSPLKKSKILDSSFEEDLFSKNNTKKLEIPPVSRLLSASPERKSSKGESSRATNITILPQKPETRSQSPFKSSPKPALKDITNISTDLLKSPRNTKEVLYPESDEENSIILISNSKENIEQDVSASEKPESTEFAKDDLVSENNYEKDVSFEVSKKSTEISELHQDKTQEQLPDLTKEYSSQQILETGSSSVAASQSQDDQDKIELQPSPTHHSSEPETKSNNKSILQSISRLFKSPQLQRSRSPFLDAHYRGSDHIDDSVPIIGPNDTPIEESTDHQIQLEPKSGVVENKSQSISPEAKNEQNVLQGVESPKVGNSSSDYQSVEDIGYDKNDNEANFWMPTDTNKLFENLEPLETARNYLKELKDLDYDLNDDIDGRISYFINEMPENELEMTISEWILYSAQQGKKHIQKVCDNMLDQFDEECERAINKLNQLPTE